MRLTVNRSDLWAGIETILDSVSSKPAMPVLNNILLEADFDGLILSATDIDMSMQTEIEAEVEETGMTTMPARKFAEIVKEWRGETIDIVVEDHRMRMRGVFGEEEGDANYTLSGIAPEEFPPIPNELDGIDLVVGDDGKDASVIANMINLTSFCVSEDTARAHLSGVLWRIDSYGMEMVATDGNRLACYRLELDLSSHLSESDETSIIVPPGALSNIVSMLTDCKEKVYITVGATQLLVRVGHTCLISRLIEGPYVNYAQVIPQANTKEMVVNRDHFLPAVRRVSILCSSFTRSIRFRISAGQIELSATSAEVGGEAIETIPVQYGDDDLNLYYNSQFLMDALRRMDTDTICFQMHDHVTAAIVTPSIQDEGEDYFCLLMPLRPIDHTSKA